MLEMITFNPPETTDGFQQLTHIAAQNRPGPVASYSVPWPEVSSIAFLRYAANSPRIYWESQKVSAGFAGCGIAAKLTACGPDRFHTIQRKVDHVFENIILMNNETPPGIGPRLFGGFAFRSNHTPEGPWSAFPAACFILPRYLLSRVNDQMWLTVNHPLGPEDDPMGIKWLLRAEMLELQRGFENLNTQNGTANSLSEPQSNFKDLMEPTTWQRLVTDATRRIRRGELDKVVLACARQMNSPRSIEPADVLTRLERNYPNCYRFLFEPIPGHAFYGATPELLAKVTGSTLRAVALAGSIRRGSTPEEDETLGQQLLATPKERHEHALVVETVEENLHPLVADLHVAPQPGLRRLSNIQHIETVIEGELARDCGILPVVEALHPTPALGGRPRKVALELIEQSEPISRGWYGSPIGWLDHQSNGMFAVAIRSAVSVGRKSMLFAGAGIVADSQPEKEWRETQLKFKPLMEALNGVKAQ